MKKPAGIPLSLRERVGVRVAVVTAAFSVN
jgi:hypothetical protein